MTSSFTLEPLAPFRLDLTAWALRRRPSNAVDRYDGDSYRRVLRLADAVADVEVRQLGSPDVPRLAVSVETDRPGCDVRAEVEATLHRMLGVDVDLCDFYERAERDPHLGPLVERYRGLKPPRFPSIFECLTNAVACQQLTLTVGITVLNRLAEAFGPIGRDAARGFPSLTDIDGVDPRALREIGFSNAKARALVEAAHRIACGDLDIEKLEAADDDAASKALQDLWGIGRWSAEYTLLRGLGRLGVFPADDVGARNNLRRIIDLDSGIRYEGIRHVVSRWAPYSGLVYFHLLLDRIDEAGWLHSYQD